MRGYLQAMGRYASFSGRSSRAEFWQFTIITTVINFVALGVTGSMQNGPNSVAGLLALLVIIVHALPSIGVAVRRLHDTDRSGWFLFINVIPVLGIVLLLIWACEAGTPGRNRFGLPADNDAPEPYAAPAAAPPVARDVIGEVERLAQLKASGSLSDGEFEVLKAKALGRG